MFLFNGLRKLMTWQPSRKRDVLRYVRGYAVEWGTRYPFGPYGNQWDKQFTFLPGAFNACLSNCPDIALTKDLDGKTIFARTGDCTLDIQPDNFGLLVEAELLDTPENWELCRLIDANRIRGWSHYWRPTLGGFHKRDENGVELFEHHTAVLKELTLVVNKRPRAMYRKSPIFLCGGPGTTEAADVL